MSNNIVTSVYGLTDGNIDNNSDNAIVCFDMEQGFIGVHKSDPEYQIDVNGTIRCSILKVAGETLSASG